jgi:hypothetical protein
LHDTRVDPRDGAAGAASRKKLGQVENDSDECKENRSKESEGEPGENTVSLCATFDHKGSTHRSTKVEYMKRVKTAIARMPTASKGIWARMEVN